MNEQKQRLPIKKILVAAGQAWGKARQLLGSAEHREGLIVLIALSLVVGWIFSGAVHGPRTASDSPGTARRHEAEKDVVWTCSMHPQIQLHKPGKCPICGMNLIPLVSSAEEGMPSARRLVMSPDAMKLAEVETRPVERKFVSTDIRMVGKIEYDETRIAYITAWTGGRIDRLYIDQTGVPVRKGDHTAYIYSPELLSAQEEYLQALESVEQVKETHLDIIRSTSADTVENAREKLKLLGVTDQQIKELEKRKVPSDHMTIFAPVSGIVVSREVAEGDYIKTGSRIYSIVDLSHVWVKLDAYEADLQWLRYGQDVQFEAEAYPGDIFHGRISFIDPVLNEVTRTVKVRVNVDNEDGRLKPGMFVRAVVKAEIAQEGRVMDTYLTGKWICPMHPEVIREEAGACPICEMPLVCTEMMGYVPTTNVTPSLVVPASAVLKTGKRAVVYVRLPNADKPVFEGREIALGPRTGDYYLVKSGLEEGELVVTQGNFKIDSALQIQAKPSMMNPEGGGGGGGHDMSKMGGSSGKMESKDTSEAMIAHAMAPQAFLEQLGDVYASYFDVHKALAKDDLPGTITALGRLEESLSAVDMNLLKGKLHADWMDLEQRLGNSVALGLGSKTLNDLRADSFKDLASQVLGLERKFGHAGETTYYEIFCPMALNGTGASWLQSRNTTMNPFFGKSMPDCGDVKNEYVPRSDMGMAATAWNEATQAGTMRHEGSHHEQ